jgi:hypothetical protein
LVNVGCQATLADWHVVLPELFLQYRVLSGVRECVLRICAMYASSGSAPQMQRSSILAVF